MPFRRVVLTVCVKAALALAPTASAQTTRCRGNPYGAIDPKRVPHSDQHARDQPAAGNHWICAALPRRPIRRRVRAVILDCSSAVPRTHYPFTWGARWDAGIWHLTYQTRESKQNPGNLYWHATAKHGRERVTMDLGS